MDTRFVSKLLDSFSDHIRDNIVYSAVSGNMDVSSVEVYSVYDTEADTGCGKLRFAAYRSPKGTRKTLGYLKRQGGEEAEKRFSYFSKRIFACGDDTVRRFSEVILNIKAART